MLQSLAFAAAIEDWFVIAAPSVAELLVFLLQQRVWPSQMLMQAKHVPFGIGLC